MHPKQVSKQGTATSLLAPFIPRVEGAGGRRTDDLGICHGVVGNQIGSDHVMSCSMGFCLLTRFLAYLLHIVLCMVVWVFWSNEGFCYCVFSTVLVGVDKSGYGVEMELRMLYSSTNLNNYYSMVQL